MKYKNLYVAESNIASHYVCEAEWNTVHEFWWVKMVVKIGNEFWLSSQGLLIYISLNPPYLFKNRSIYQNEKLLSKWEIYFNISALSKRTDSALGLWSPSSEQSKESIRQSSGM
jgi:hypothetical protein